MEHVCIYHTLMGEAAIRVVGISKQYVLGAKERSNHRFCHDTLSETLCRSLSRRRGASPRQKSADSKEFWALRDVSFTVEPGEVMGIVGRNGSGKSTLLKILSRITEPTSGYADIDGRVGSLLEVGTGFHPQLTGRENIYLNGAILGMTQAEVRSKFDEIVDFSEVERFLDTPVKNYSSGMYTRLAFAVAAYLDTEILIVDEVLAVGDAEFQKKCLRKMQSVADRDGRTVLFVSHNMAAVSELTHKCILLKKGEVAYVGHTAAAIEDYLTCDGNLMSSVFDVENVPRKLSGSLKVKLTRLRFDRPVAHFSSTDEISFVASFRAMQDVENIQFSVTIFTHEGIPIGNSCGPDQFSFRKDESRQVKIVLPTLRLAPGRYHCRVALGQGNEAGTWKNFDAVADTLNFEVVSRPFANSGSGVGKRGCGSIIFPKLEAEIIEDDALAVIDGQSNK
jgi:lipopolysaccharide transport system ATP-binding protein